VSLERALFARLTVGTPIAAIGNRVFPVAAPLSVALPYVVTARVSAQRVRSTIAPSGLTMARMQIDTYAAGYLGAREVADAIRKRLDGWRGLVTGSGWSCRVEGSSLQSDQDLHEPDIRPVAIFRVSQDFLISYQED
jgi:hypothetical protein